MLKIPGPNEEPQYVADYIDELSEPLQWLPPTVASVALRLQVPPTRLHRPRWAHPYPLVPWESPKFTWPRSLSCGRIHRRTAAHAASLP